MRLAIEHFEGFGAKARYDFLCCRGPDAFDEAAAEVFLDGSDSCGTHTFDPFRLELPAKLRVFDPCSDALN